jgi:polyphenol oxidase
MRLGSALLSAIPGLRHAFFTRDGGVSDGVYGTLNGGIGSSDDPANVAENRRRMAEEMGVTPQCFLSAHQTHSPDAVAATGPWQGASRPRADAIVTRSAGLAIGITAADCGPILLVDPNARVIGAAHAGWKGALTGIVESTVDAMEKLGAERSGMVAAIGPLIRQHSTKWATNSLSDSCGPMRRTPSSSSPRRARVTRCSTSLASSECDWKTPEC